MSVQNQKIVIVNKEAADKEHLFALYNLEVLKTAMNTLKGETFKLWIYLGKNQSQYKFELSVKDAMNWGIKKDAYYSGIDTLQKLGYLVPAEDGSNVFNFNEGGLAQ